MSQAALLAEVLALGRQVDAVETHQQLRPTDAFREASSQPGWVSLAPKMQQAQAEIQASLCDAHVHHRSQQQAGITVLVSQSRV